MRDDTQPKVGIVTYQLGSEPGTMLAEWATLRQKRGIVCKGNAYGGPISGFSGDFKILYSDENGQPDEQAMDLKIESRGDVYYLIWTENGNPIHHGVGMLCEGKLVVGWGPVH